MKNRGINSIKLGEVKIITSFPIAYVCNVRIKQELHKRTCAELNFVLGNVENESGCAGLLDAIIEIRCTDKEGESSLFYGLVDSIEVKENADSKIFHVHATSEETICFKADWAMRGGYHDRSKLQEQKEPERIHATLCSRKEMKFHFETEKNEEIENDSTLFQIKSSEYKKVGRWIVFEGTTYQIVARELMLEESGWEFFYLLKAQTRVAATHVPLAGSPVPFLVELFTEGMKKPPIRVAEAGMVPSDIFLPFMQAKNPAAHHKFYSYGT